MSAKVYRVRAVVVETSMVAKLVRAHSAKGAEDIFRQGFDAAETDSKRTITTITVTPTEPESP